MVLFFHLNLRYLLYNQMMLGSSWKKRSKGRGVFFIWVKSKYIFGMIFRKPVFLLFLLLNVAFLFADPVSVNSIHETGSTTRDRQLREFLQAFRPGVSSYFNFGINYTPLSSQLPLESPFGIHDGYAFSQHATVFISMPAFEKKIVDLGAFWSAERHGWDTEDFLFFPAYEKFSFIRSIQTGGFTFSYPKIKLGAALGVQYQNIEKTNEVYPDESDSLYFWGHAYFGKVALQTSFHKADWRHVRVGIDLESKAVLGGDSSGWKTYLPNFDVALFNGDEDDSVKITWEQNLYKQMLYSRVSAFLPDHGFSSASLTFYPDPSRLFSLEASMFKKENGDFVFGGGIDLLFLRVAYNQAYDYENFFGAKGTVIVELHFALSSIEKKFFGLNAAKPAPMEDQQIRIPSAKDFGGAK